MKYYLLVLVSMVVFILLTGCAGMPSPQEVAAETIDTVNQTSSVVNNQIDTKTLIIIIFLAGWALPSFSSMFGGLFGGIFKVLKLIFLRKL